MRSFFYFSIYFILEYSYNSLITLFWFEYLIERFYRVFPPSCMYTWGKTFSWERHSSIFCDSVSCGRRGAGVSWAGCSFFFEYWSKDLLWGTCEYQRVTQPLLWQEEDYVYIPRTKALRWSLLLLLLLSLIIFNKGSSNTWVDPHTFHHLHHYCHPILYLHKKYGDVHPDDGSLTCWALLLYLLFILKALRLLDGWFLCFSSVVLVVVGVFFETPISYSSVVK